MKALTDSEKVALLEGRWDSADLFAYSFPLRKEDGKHLIREEFLTFVHADKGTNAEELTTKFLETIQSIGLSVNDMRAQRYDGTSVISGHKSSV